MNEAILPDYLTVGEVSESLRLGPSTIYKLLKENKLPARKIGGRWRISRRALDEWIEGDMTKSGEDEEYSVNIITKPDNG